jgi:phosphatidylserine/phosphatidylglycerophosphate/cardiolipin synthase-like enzyme
MVDPSFFHTVSQFSPPGPKEMGNQDSHALAERRKQKGYYDFGERPTLKSAPDLDINASKFMSFYTRFTSTSSRIGCFIANIFAALIGAVIARTHFALTSGAHAVNNLFNQYKCGNFLPPQSPSGSERAKVGTYLSTNLRLSKSADEGFEWKKTLLRSAERSIEISANYAGGKDFQEILSLIDERMKAKPELKTHLLINPEMLEHQDKAQLKALKQAYPDRLTVVIHGPHMVLFPALHTEENHVKLVVVDNKYFVMGGTSIHPQLAHQTATNVKSLKSPGSKMLDMGARDNDIICESEEAARVMRASFFKLFRLCEQQATNKEAPDRFFAIEGAKGYCDPFHTQPGLFERVRLKVIVGGPEHGDENPIVAQYVKRINKARDRVFFANMQFNPDSKIKNALRKKQASDRPIHTILITNGMKEKSCLGKCFTVITSRGNYKYIDAPYEYQVSKTQYHKKVAVFDTNHMIIGSANIGPKSAGYDREIICDIKDERVTAAMKEILDQDLKSSAPIQRESTLSRLLTEIAASLFSPSRHFV